MRLRRFYVAGFPADYEKQVLEFLFFHGVFKVKVIDRPEIEKLQVDCIYAHEARQ